MTDAMLHADASNAPAQPPPKKRRRFTLRRLLVLILIGLVIGSCNVAPLWRLLWYWPIYPYGQFRKVKDAQGTPREAWRWIEGRTIRIFTHPAARAGRTEEVADGVRALLEDAGLDFSVEVRPMPDEVLTAYVASLVEEPDERDRPRKLISIEKLQSQRAARIQADPCGEVIIVAHPIAEAPSAFGMASFSGGLVLLTPGHADRHTAKHETCHLLGYMQHDDFPLFVIGYPWEGWPWRRNTLMMLLTTSDQVSPRARDALRAFWRGIERRTGRRYLADPAMRRHPDAG